MVISEQFIIIIIINIINIIRIYTNNCRLSILKRQFLVTKIEVIITKAKSNINHIILSVLLDFLMTAFIRHITFLTALYI